MTTVLRALCVTSATVLALAAPSGTRAQGVADTTALDARIEARVRTLVSEAWEVPGERLVLEPGSIRAGWTVPERPVVELLGSGGGGNWVVRVGSEEPGVEAQSFRVRAGVLTPTAVAAHALTRGQSLGQGDIGQETRVLWGPPRPDDGPSVEVGWVAARVIDKGEELRRPALHPPLAVRSGTPIQLVWKRGGVALRVTGRAAGSAAMGEDVLVRTETGERLQGVVVAPGVVDVTGPGSKP